MALFLAAGIPAFLVLLGKLILSGPFDGRAALGEAARGALCFLPGMPVYSLVAGAVSPAFDGGALYAARTFLDLALPLALGLGAYLIFHRKELILSGEAQFLRAFSFLSGFFSLFALYCAFAYPPWLGSYLYFLLPLAWMSLLPAASLSLGAFFSIVSGRRFFFPVGLVALVLLAGLVPFLFVANHRPAAWALALAVFLGSLPALRWIFPVLR